MPTAAGYQRSTTAQWTSLGALVYLAIGSALLACSNNAEPPDLSREQGGSRSNSAGSSSSNQESSATSTTAGSSSQVLATSGTATTGGSNSIPSSTGSSASGGASIGPSTLSPAANGGTTASQATRLPIGAAAAAPALDPQAKRTKGAAAPKERLVPGPAMAMPGQRRAMLPVRLPLPRAEPTAEVRR